MYGNDRLVCAFKAVIGFVGNIDGAQICFFVSLSFPNRSSVLMALSLTMNWTVTVSPGSTRLSIRPWGEISRAREITASVLALESAGAVCVFDALSSDFRIFDTCWMSGFESTFQEASLARTGVPISKEEASKIARGLNSGMVDLLSYRLRSGHCGSGGTFLYQNCLVQSGGFGFVFPGFPDDLSIEQRHRMIGVLCDFGIVGNEQNCLSKAMGKRDHHVHDCDARFGIEVSGRLICENDLRLMNKRPGDADALLLTAGHLGRVMVHPVLQTDHFQHFPRTDRSSCLIHPRKLKRHRHVFERRILRQQIVRLENEAGMVLAKEDQLLFVHFFDVALAYDDFPARGRFQSGQKIEHRTFSRTGRTEYAADFSGKYIKGNIAQRGDFFLTHSIHFGNVPDAHNRLFHPLHLLS